MPDNERSERPAGWCSFCRRNYRDVGPLAEGPGQVYICYPCVQKCADIIEHEARRLGVPLKIDDRV